ncbi:DUF4433 domain-containing protein (plasmid) [Chromobacterium amazonense]|uniref:type II toxin-antitoxin system toxin DNA ADP-ribosyl transferase DarT n=1 Tax=Chromobacterium amazonense TaxID=1382803 RepID=UPI00237D6B64|nr:DUF4433 domain-containing protein [Chromobacterium amazonense]MDE1713603.1 DUF4433 domain-containing protein [Chromobacterium amazonense]
MPAPRPVKLFHITAIANLPAILATGALLAKNAGAAAGINYQNIAHRGAQSTRASREVPNPPGGRIHDYVPFYFAPRSPMLFAIHGGQVDGCTLRQDDIVHWVTTVDAVTANGAPFVFYDRNATLRYSVASTDLADLDSLVAWDELLAKPQLDGYCQYWQNNAKHPDRMERRMAEFLVHERVPLQQMLGLGVYKQAKAEEVRAILDVHGLNLPVKVKQAWYF